MRDVLKKRVGDYDIGRTLGEVRPRLSCPTQSLALCHEPLVHFQLGCRAHMPRYGEHRDTGEAVAIKVRGDQHLVIAGSV